MFNSLQVFLEKNVIHTFFLIYIYDMRYEASYYYITYMWMIYVYYEFHALLYAYVWISFIPPPLSLRLLYAFLINLSIASSAAASSAVLL
jgi:hypothetical protein